MVNTAQSSQSNWYFRVSLPGDGSWVNSVLILFLPARKPRCHRCCPDEDFHTTPNDDFSTRYLTFLLFLKSFFVCFCFFFESFFSENHFENIENCSAPKVCTHLRKAEAKWLFSFNDYGNAFHHKQHSEEECFRMLARRHSTSWFRKTFWIYAEFSFRKVLVRLKSSVFIKEKRPLSYSINDTLISLSLFSFWKTTLKIA